MWGRLLKGEKAGGPDVGAVAPDFSLPSTAGDTFTLSEAVRKGPVVFAFFKVTCSTCQFTFPFLDRLYRSYQRHGVEFRGISQDDAEQSKAFARKFGVTFPLAIDAPSYAASRLFHFAYVPTILLVSQAGKIRFRSTGFSRAGTIELSKEIARLVGRTPERVFLPNESVPELKPG